MKIKISDREIGEDKPVFFIAEAELNHNGDLDIAKKLVDAAKKAGADAIKFQMYKSESLVCRDTPGIISKKKREDNQFNILKKYELNIMHFREIANYCKKAGIIFLCTPHTEDVVEGLNPLIPAYKIGSGDLTNIPFLKKIAKKEKPIILGTGMATTEEIDKAVKAIREEGNNQIALLHCTTSYPCEYEDVNLRAMITMKERFGKQAVIGYSDHTFGELVPTVAVALGAKIIEKHFTLSKNMPGPDHEFSATPEEFRKVVEHSKNAVVIQGTGIKGPTAEEKETMKIARKSIIAKRDIKVGEKFSWDNLAIKRPGTGFPPIMIDKLIGKTAVQNISQDKVIEVMHFLDENSEKKRKVVYVSGTRADYGLMKNVLRKIRADESFDLKIIATGMHLMDKYGKTVDEIRRDGFRVEIADAVFEGDRNIQIANFLARATEKISNVLEREKPDLMIVLGDRVEMLAAAQSASYLRIPIAHIHGGDVSGTIDDVTRHTITKMAHIHFPATQQSAKRINAMGEEKWRINVVGAPSLDNIANIKINRGELKKRYNLPENFAIVCQHPVTDEEEHSGIQMTNTLEAARLSNVNPIVIYPNADAGREEMAEIIEDYSKKFNFKAYKSIPYEDFIGLMSMARLMIGNSSSGIIEAASFKLPVVNIGTRQRGRERSGNVIDCFYRINEIRKAISIALSGPFKEKTDRIVNVYGDGKTAGRIVNILKNINLTDKRILSKRMD